MKIESIFIRNFRPIGEQGLELIFKNKNTIFIGENNVGKSSIFEAIKKTLNPQNPFDIEDWYAGDQSKPIDIHLNCILDDTQIDKLISILTLPLTVQGYKQNFTERLSYKLRKSIGPGSSCFFKLGELEIKNNDAYLVGRAETTQHHQTNWADFIERMNLRNNEFSLEKIKNYLKSIHPSPNTFNFRVDITKELQELIKNSIIIIEEFREKSLNVLSESVISPTGKELPSVLFNLKNSRAGQKKKYEQIRKKFHELFPTLNVDVIKEKGEIKILIEKSKIESTTFYLGAGILESLLLLTHLLAHSDKVLCVDHPELHLHPHAQRCLNTFIEGSDVNQILTITHSPYFANLNKTCDIMRFINKDMQTAINKLPQNYFADEEYFKLEQFLDIDTKELFFSRKCILAEGPTEIGALPIFASKLGYDLDENGVSVVNMGGKRSVELFVKLCDGFRIPYFIIGDNDAEELLSKYKSKFVLPGQFEDLLPKELLEEAKKVVGDSKPRIGRYAARKMVQEDMNIPEVIQQIVEQIKQII